MKLLKKTVLFLVVTSFSISAFSMMDKKCYECPSKINGDPCKEVACKTPEA